MGKWDSIEESPFSNASSVFDPIFWFPEVNISQVAIDIKDIANLPAKLRAIPAADIQSMQTHLAEAQPFFRYKWVQCHLPDSAQLKSCKSGLQLLLGTAALRQQVLLFPGQAQCVYLTHTSAQVSCPADVLCVRSNSYGCHKSKQEICATFILLGVTEKDALDAGESLES